MRNVKVLHITSRADIGGGPKHVLDLVQGLNKLKTVESYIAAPENYHFSYDFKESCKKFISIPHRKFSPITFIKLLYFIKQNEIGILHSHGRGAGVYSRLLSFFGLSVIHTFHGVHAEKSLIGLVKVYLDKILKLCTKQFICVSYDEEMKAKDIGFLHNQKVSVIHNGVNISEINQRRIEKQDILNVTLLSRLTYQKGIDLLIHNLRNFPYKNIKINIYGDGEDDALIKNLIASNKLNHLITLKGSTTKPLEVLSETDIFLSSSRWEGFPISVLEAMASGLPCLLSNVTGHNDFSNSVIKFYDLYDSNDFQSSLSELANNYDLRCKLGVRARTEAVNNYSSKLMATRTQALYLKV